MRTSAEMYQFLSLCLLYPTTDLASAREAAAQAVGRPWAAELAACFSEASLEALQVEHTRLFTTNAGGVPCPPYESAYVDGQLLTTTTAAVATFYSEWGLEQAQETADFLPVELQFSAWLVELTGQADAPEGAFEARRRFEREHLLRWLPQFSADLQEHAGLDCYRLLGARLAEFATALGRSD